MSNDPTDPDHYKQGRVECWDFAGEMGFLLGSATKYLYRAGHKDDPVVDLGKACQYIRREMSERMAGRGVYNHPSAQAESAFAQWCQDEDGSLRSEIAKILWAENKVHGGLLLGALQACESWVVQIR